MDFASTFQRPILFHGGDGASYCFPNRFISPKGINITFGDSKVHSCFRLRRNVAQSGTLNLNACFSGRFYTGPLHSTKSILGNGHQAKRISFGFRLSCHGNDSLGSADSSNDRIGESSESNGGTEATDLKEEKDVRVENETDSLEELKELLQKAIKELEVARLNSTMFEEKAQRISERAIALKDEAATAWHDVNKTLDVIQDTVADSRPKW